jgi:hypothetical protein
MGSEPLAIEIASLANHRQSVLSVVHHALRIQQAFAVCQQENVLIAPAGVFSVVVLEFCSRLSLLTD